MEELNLERGLAAPVRNQPVQRFLAGLERGQVPLRERLQVFVENFGQAVRSHPGGTLDVRPVKYQRGLDPFYRLLVHFRAREVGQEQHRSARFSGNPRRHQIGKFFQFFGGAIGAIHQQDLLALVADETDAVFHTPLTAPEYSADKPC